MGSSRQREVQTKDFSWEAAAKRGEKLVMVGGGRQKPQDQGTDWA